MSRDRSRNRPPLPTTSVLRALLLAPAIGIVFGWASVFLIPTARSLGLSEARAQDLPFFGFVLGAIWGIAAVLSQSARDLLVGLLAPPLLGALFYIFGVLLGGVLVGLGAERVAEWMPALGFCLGAVVGSVPVVGMVLNALSSLRRR